MVFHQLSRPEILEIVELMMDQVRGELAEKQVELELTESAKSYLGEKGFDPVLGARPLRRLIQNEVEDRLSDEILSGRLGAGDMALIDYTDDVISISSSTVRCPRWRCPRWSARGGTGPGRLTLGLHGRDDRRPPKSGASSCYTRGRI